jgi:NAD+ synthase (glutamine-hydrolysing)
MKNFKDLGYYKVCSASPKMEVADPMNNVQEIIRLTTEAAGQENFAIVFPELSITGYSCEDLFHNQDLIDLAKKAINLLLTKTSDLNIISVIGTPYQTPDGRLYNTALICYKGEIIGGNIKSFLPNYNEFYEARYFSSGEGRSYDINDFGQKFLLNNNQLYKMNDVVFGIEICEEAWAPHNPAIDMTISGANIIFNLSASNELVGKAEYRKSLVEQHSARLNCAYVYSSASSNESSKDIVFGGHCLIAENGSIKKESNRFNFDSEIIEFELDLNKIQMERRKNTTFGASRTEKIFKTHNIDMIYSLSKLNRSYNKSPFIPSDDKTFKERAEEILNIQTTGLIKRLKSVNSSRLVLGLSGGLDSTLASLIALRSLKQMNAPLTDLITISMPGFGTSERTKNQARNLAHSLSSTFKEINISNAVSIHLKDIDQPEGLFDNTYENAQARERTQILFDYANKEKGMVLGTGDLSEIALGWCTFGGDHLSNYNVNASVPKSLVKYLVKYYAEHYADSELKNTLLLILDTTISPELLPIEDKEVISQSTEDVLGPYEIHDFILYHVIRNGFGREKIEYLTHKTFIKDYSKIIIEKTLNIFFKRFIENQFKRTTAPPGPKVGSVSLSPRGDWRQPDEAKLWKK